MTIETLEKGWEMCSKLTIKTPERRQWRRFGAFIVNFEDISHNISHNSVSIVDFEQVYVSWVKFHNPAGIFLFKVNNGKVQTHHLFPNFKKS